MLPSPALARGRSRFSYRPGLILALLLLMVAAARAGEAWIWEKNGEETFDCHWFFSFFFRARSFLFFFRFSQPSPTSSLFLTSSRQQTAPPPTVLFQLSDLHLCDWASSSPSLLASKGSTAKDAVAWASAVVAPARRALSLSSSSSSSSSSSYPSSPPPISIPLLVTGDLTHAKTRDGGTLQSREEWRAYSELLRDLERAAGIQESAVLDVRGNHDGFDVPARGSPQDHFPEFTAAGRRKKGGAGKETVADRRVFAAAVAASGEVTHLDDDAERAFLEKPSPSSSLSPTLPSCPALLLLGIDAAQDPGLSGSNNFAGRLTPELSRKVVAAAGVLRGAAEKACSGGGGGGSEGSSSSPDSAPLPPLLAYGHFPLSTVEKSVGARKRKKENGKGGEGVSSNGGDLDLDLDLDASSPLPPHLSDLLASPSVSADAYVAGHLHSLFGGRMHRALPKKKQAEGNGNGGGTLAEWEAASFADSRRFRLLVSDKGSLTFSDWHWHSPAGPAAYANSTGFDPAASPRPRPFVSAAVSRTSTLQPAEPAAGGWLLHLSSPPDARFASSFSGVALGSLRALALPLALGGGGGEGGVEGRPPERVRASWTCVPSGERGSVDLLASPSSSSTPFLFEAAWPEAGCPSGDHAAEVELEAFSEGGGGEGAALAAAARAPARPVALVKSPSSSSDFSTVGIGPHGALFPLPARTSTLEAFFVSVDWARFARRLFWGLWAGWLVAGLLLPRAAAVAFLRMRKEKAEVEEGEKEQIDLADALCAAAARARPALLGPFVAGLLAWPLVAAVDNASPSENEGNGDEKEKEKEGNDDDDNDKGAAAAAASSSPAFSSSFLSRAPWTWRLQLAYACYIALGPWAVVRTLSASPPGLYFPWGVLVRMPPVYSSSSSSNDEPSLSLSFSSVLPFLSSLSAVPTPDAARVGAMHLCFCVAPFSLWLAAVVSACRRAERREEGKNKEEGKKVEERREREERRRRRRRELRAAAAAPHDASRLRQPGQGPGLLPDEERRGGRGGRAAGQQDGRGGQGRGERERGRRRKRRRDFSFFFSFLAPFPLALRDDDFSAFDLCRFVLALLQPGKARGLAGRRQAGDPHGPGPDLGGAGWGDGARRREGL
jgi:hypothetical protein